MGTWCTTGLMVAHLLALSKILFGVFNSGWFCFKHGRTAGWCILVARVSRCCPWWLCTRHLGLCSGHRDLGLREKEDLDSLISVSTDKELDNKIDEYTIKQLPSPTLPSALPPYAISSTSPSATSASFIASTSATSALSNSAFAMPANNFDHNPASFYTMMVVDKESWLSKC